MQRFIPILLLLISGMFVSPTSSELLNSDHEVELNAAIKGDDLLSRNITKYSPEVDIGSKSDNILVGDNKISPIWEFIQGSEVTSWGEHGLIKSAFDDSSAYFLITVDITINWFAIQLDTDYSTDPENIGDEMEPMAEGDDLWIIGETSEVSVLGDASSAGQSKPYAIADESNDLYWERVVINDTEGVPLYVNWEVKRSLDTNDVAGMDAVFSSETNITMILASDMYHKTLAKVVMLKFALTSLTLGGDEPEPVAEDEEVEEIRDVAFYLFYYVSISFFIGSLTYSTITVLTVYLLKKEIDDDE